MTPPEKPASCIRVSAFCGYEVILWRHGRSRERDTRSGRATAHARVPQLRRQPPAGMESADWQSKLP